MCLSCEQCTICIIGFVPLGFSCVSSNSVIILSHSNDTIVAVWVQFLAFVYHVAVCREDIQPPFSPEEEQLLQVALVTKKQAGRLCAMCLHQT